MTSIIEIRSKIPEDIFDYQQLMEVLSGYSKPRDRLSSLLHSGQIIRIRKGLYTFTEPLRRSQVCRELLANLIYGPSYVTSDYALSYYSLIPERVDIMTSVTTGRTRSFNTPFGTFAYQNYKESLYIPGITIEKNGKYTFLIASTEKALVDKIWLDKRFSGTVISSYGSYLSDDLRVDPDRLARLDFERFKLIADAMDVRKIDNLLKYLEKLMGGSHE